MATGLKLLLTMMLLSVIQIAVADALPDPTRPSIDLNNSGSGGGIDVVQVDLVPQGLQSIIISPQFSAAIINGETVSLGGKVGDSKLVEVRDNSVVLQNAQGRRVMELFPKVNIKKNLVVQPVSGAQETAPEQTNLPENAVGGVK